MMQANDTFNAQHWVNLPLTNPPSVKASSLSFHRSTTGSDRIRRISSALAIISIDLWTATVKGLTVCFVATTLSAVLDDGQVARRKRLMTRTLIFKNGRKERKTEKKMSKITKKVESTEQNLT